eukprot:1546495-Rhodomonas_salina.3
MAGIAECAPGVRNLLPPALPLQNVSVHVSVRAQHVIGPAAAINSGSAPINRGCVCVCVCVHLAPLLVLPQDRRVAAERERAWASEGVRAVSYTHLRAHETEADL